jgi:ferredoxin
MTTDRRTLLKGFAAAAASMTIVSTPALARTRKSPPSDAVGLLYDATKCVGCKACVVACKDANKMPADTRASKLYDAPDGLNEFTKERHPALRLRLVREEAVHALRRPRVRRRLHARRAAQRKVRHRQLGRGPLRRLPLLLDGLRLQRPEVRVEQGRAEARQV